MFYTDLLSNFILIFIVILSCYFLFLSIKKLVKFIKQRKKNNVDSNSINDNNSKK